MTISVYLKDANFTDFLASTAPVPDGLQVLIRPRLDASTAEKNEAFNKDDVFQNGTPTYKAYSASDINASNFYESQFTPSASGEATYIALMKEPQAQSRFLGNFFDTDGVGDMVDYISSTGTIRAFNNGKSASIVMPTVDAAKFRLFFAAFKPLETTVGYSDGGIINPYTASSTEDRTTLPARMARLGWAYSGSNANNEVAAFLVWDRYLSVAEIKEVQEWLVGVYGANLDIT